MDLKILSAALLFILGVFTLCQCQQRSIPNMIINCYKNSTAYNRYTRQPMHIDNLISIIRKIEKNTFYTWDMRRIARTVLKKYQFNGLSYDPMRKQGFEFETDPLEDHQTTILHNLLGGEDILPDGTLDNDESCSLHWMLSSSINATLRDDEFPFRLRAKRSAWKQPNSGNTDDTEIEQNHNNNNDNDNDHDKLDGKTKDSDYDADYHYDDISSQTRVNTGRLETGKVITLGPQSPTTTPTTAGPQAKSTTRGPSKLTTNNAQERIPNIHVDDHADVDVDDSFVEYQSDRAEHYAPGNKFAKQVNFPTTKQPIETGVVYTKWGSISAGKLIAGIAAGLEPMELPVTDSNSGSYIPTFGTPNNNPGGSGSGTGSGSGSGSNPWGTGNGNGNGNGGSGFGTNNNNNNNNNNGNSNWNSRYNEPSYPRTTFRQGGRWKRQAQGEYLPPLLNLHAATVAGDVGQAAILNAVYSAPFNVPPPSGRFNDSTCPREYILDPLSNPTADVSHEHDTWSYMTAAEIRGGVDGLILGLNIREWDNRNMYRLSQILQMYYSEGGVSFEPRFRACDRSSNFPNIMNQADLLAQAKSFAYIYNNRTSKLKVGTADNIRSLYQLVEETFSKMSGFASSLSSVDPPCTQRVASSGNVDMPDDSKQIPAQTTLYAVLDYSDTTDQDLAQQKNFVAQLAYELNVSPAGSRIGLVNGASGQVLIKPNATDNPARLACQIQGERTLPQNQINLVATLETLRTEITRVKSEEERTNYTDNNGIVIMVMNQGKKFDENQRIETRSRINELSNELGDVHVMFVTSKNQVSDYKDFALDTEQDVIRLQSSTGNLSSETSRFKTEFLKRNHARITYPRCNANRYEQEDEQKIGTDLYISPNTIQYYKISPDYFFSAKNLRFRFSSDNGKVRVCISRQDRFPNIAKAGTNGVTCFETSGQYQPAGSTTADLEIPYPKPCGGDGKRAGCSPIFLSITPISSSAPGSVPLDCSADVCRSDQVKVTFSHWDMRCNSNSAIHTLVSLPGLLTALLVSIVTFTKYS